MSLKNVKNSKRNLRNQHIFNAARNACSMSDIGTSPFISFFNHPTSIKWLVSWTVGNRLLKPLSGKELDWLNFRLGEIIGLIHVLEKRYYQNKTQLRYKFGSVYKMNQNNRDTIQYHEHSKKNNVALSTPVWQSNNFVCYLGTLLFCQCFLCALANIASEFPVKMAFVRLCLKAWCLRVLITVLILFYCNNADSFIQINVHFRETFYIYNDKSSRSAIEWLNACICVTKLGCMKAGSIDTK